MKFKPSEISDLLKASYNVNNFNVGKFIIDPILSDVRMKVYIIEGVSDVVVVHRGSQDIIDWVDNVSYLRNNDIKNSKTYKMHLRRHKKAVNKYGKENIIVLGHSRAALYADQLYKDKLAKQVITYNKPINFNDVVNSALFKTKEDENKTNIRTSGDIPSMGDMINPKNVDILIPSKSYNPLYEHKTDRITKLNDDDDLIGTGIFKKEIDFSKLRKKDLKQFIKNNKKKLNIEINLTGLTKKQMVKIVKEILALKN
jgi:hypothetical protein